MDNFEIWFGKYQSSRASRLLQRKMWIQTMFCLNAYLWHVGNNTAFIHAYIEIPFHRYCDNWGTPSLNWKIASVQVRIVCFWSICGIVMCKSNKCAKLVHLSKYHHNYWLWCTAVHLVTAYPIHVCSRYKKVRIIITV